MAWKQDENGAWYEETEGQAPPTVSNGDPSGYLGSLAARYGVPIGETDLANLQGKNPEDVGTFRHDLENQYALRARATASGGGIGGSADLDGNGAIDAGWTKNAGGQYEQQAAGGGDWWTANAPGGAPAGAGSDFGAPPAPFGETYSTLARPSYLQGEFVPPQWNETFKPPTMDEIMAEPGYQTGLNSGILSRERSAAANGSILNGGTQKALTRFGTDYGATKAGESIGRLFDQYQQRYGQFENNAARTTQARGINENAFQTDSANNLNQYNTRYTGYLDAITNKRNAENDLWGRNQDQVRNSLTAAGLARPS